MSDTSFKIRIEQPSDRQAIWDVNRIAFDSDAEAKLVDELRAGASLLVGLTD